MRRVAERERPAISSELENDWGGPAEPDEGGGSGEFRLELELPADSKLLGVARGAVEHLAREAGFSEDESCAINLALGEAMANIIQHAYDGQSGGTFQLICHRLLEGLEFLLLDRGRAADPAEFRSRPLGELRTSGFGTHIIAQVMDEVRYERRQGTNRLRMVKRMKRRRAARNRSQNPEEDSGKLQVKGATGDGQMQITTRRSGDATILDVQGDIDLYNSPEVRKVLLGALRNEGAPRVVVNLKGVRYIDSSGVASLVEGLKVSRDLRSRLVLFGLSPAAREVLELTRLIRVFEVYENEEEALRA